MDEGKTRVGRGWGLVLVALAVGCGGEPPGAPPQGGQAPIDSDAVAVVSTPLVLDEVARADVLAQGRMLGLDRVELAGDELALPPPAPIEEPRATIARETPEALVRSALDVLRAGDRAALARLVHSPTERPVLTEDDARAAARRFLGPSTRRYWDRLLAAAAAGRIEVVSEAAGEAVLRIDVGGAAGGYILRLRREGSGWYLA